MFPALDSAICVWSLTTPHCWQESTGPAACGGGCGRTTTCEMPRVLSGAMYIYIYMYIYMYICMVYTDYEKTSVEPKPFQSPTPTHIASHLASHRSNIDENCVHLSSIENSFSSTTWGNTSWEKPREIMDNKENRHIIGIEEEHKWGPKCSDPKE